MKVLETFSHQLHKVGQSRLLKWMKNLEDQTSLHGVYDCNFVSYKISRLTESWSFHLNSTFPVNCSEISARRNKYRTNYTNTDTGTICSLQPGERRLGGQTSKRRQMFGFATFLTNLREKIKHCLIVAPTK